MNFWSNLFNLSNGEENREKVLKNIREGISFKGSSLWILVCAIMVASVGLNVNSTAVVIGAMLISPLMGPIVGAGFALGMYDFKLLRKSLINLLIATIASLAVSAAYFYITPFKEAQSEILSRTSPTIYDVIIAFFGGLAGVIALTRFEKGNPIPGVAIATALMPPLCTAGYGIATGNWPFFGGALFLYIINCAFICIATFLIVKYLNYPAAGLVDKDDKGKIRWGISLIILLLTLPSVYFAYVFIQEQQYEKRLQDFIRSEFEEKGNVIIYQKTSFQTSPKQVELAFLSRKFSAAEIDSLNHKLPEYNLFNTQLNIRQDTSLLQINRQIKSVSAAAVSTDMLLQLKKELQNQQLDADAVFKEAKLLFPALNRLALAKPQTAGVSADSTHVIALYRIDSNIAKEDSVKLYRWLCLRLVTDSVTLIKQ